MTTSAKKKALLASGTINAHPEDVRSELFKMDFFDPWDRGQVKYEMLRAHSVEGDPVAEACRQFGFSRESFYQIQQSFIELGFVSFIPGKRGPQGPCQTQGRGARVCSRQEEGGSRYGSRPIGCVDQAALWHGHS